MVYDFIEVGTANFDTLAQSAGKKFGLSFEPIRELLEQVPAGPNVTKVYAGIAESTGESSIFWVPDEIIKQHNLPKWVAASSAMGTINPNILRELNERGLPHDLVQERKIATVSWQDALRQYNIDGVKYLKIDVEGKDVEVLNMFLDAVYLPDSFELPTKIKFECREEMTNWEEYGKLENRLKNWGYSVRNLGDDRLAELK